MVTQNVGSHKLILVQFVSKVCNNLLHNIRHTTVPQDKVHHVSEVPETKFDLTVDDDIDLVVNCADVFSLDKQTRSKITKGIC